jgi:processive 1,2-diacylglycerol beta-glucosyltransferase
MQASDAIVTRGGTTTCSKALHYTCPILLNGFGGVMPQERLTAKFFLQDGASVVISRPDDLRRVLREWHANPATYERMRAELARLRYDEDPTLAVRELIDLAREATINPVRLRPQARAVV